LRTITETYIAIGIFSGTGGRSFVCISSDLLLHSLHEATGNKRPAIQGISLNVCNASENGQWQFWFDRPVTISLQSQSFAPQIATWSHIESDRLPSIFAGYSKKTAT
jgi:hypothetical protein